MTVRSFGTVDRTGAAGANGGAGLASLYTCIGCVPNGPFEGPVGDGKPCKVVLRSNNGLAGPAGRGAAGGATGAAEAAGVVTGAGAGAGEIAGLTAGKPGLVGVETLIPGAGLAGNGPFGGCG
jgi:hypothetical protein